MLTKIGAQTMSSKNKPQNNQIKQQDPHAADEETNNDVSTKYGRQVTDSERSPQPACFTENEDELKAEILGHDQDRQPPHPAEGGITSEEGGDDSDIDSEDTEIGRGKYSHLITKEKIEDIEDHPEEEEEDDPNYEYHNLHVKGNVHSEVRFYSRADTSHEDAPETLQEAWKKGVRVGLEHHDRENFYGYKEARYNEVANVVMVMNAEGMIETTLNIFEESMTIKTDHLLRCGNPSCGRLYDKNVNDRCCHWCGYSQSNGRNKTKPELLPKRKSSPNAGSDPSEESNNTETVDSEHSLDTYCEECDTTFNTLTRLRLHSCDK